MPAAGVTRRRVTSLLTPTSSWPPRPFRWATTLSSPQPMSGISADTPAPNSGSRSAERVTEGVPYDVAYQRLEEGLRALAPVAERTRVNLALENVWNKLLLSPLEARDLLDRIGSEYVGWYFDTGNVVIYGYPEQWIRILGARIKKVHFKDFK